MKKIYLTLALAMTVVFASAQNFQAGPSLNVSNAKTIALKKAIAKKQSADKSISSRWYDYASTMDAYLGGNVSKLSMTYLFPDSNCLADFGGTPGNPWVHGMAIVIDPKSEWFEKDGEQLIDNNTPYTVDSVEVWMAYSRNTADSIVDTLRFEYTTTADADGMGQYYFQNMTDYNTDTLFFKAFKRTGIILDGNTKVTVDVLLHETDTVPNADGGWNVFSIAPNVQVPAGELLGVTIKFIPGYSYEDTTLITTTRNYMVMASMEENGDDTYPSYTKGDYNTSQIIPKWATVAGNNWESIYVPEWAFVQAYGFENHLITYKITADAEFTGIENTVNNGGLTVEQNRPNPFTGMTTVNYSLDKAANVDVVIYNVAGSKVMTINKGTQAAGSHKVEINASDLQAGVYYYTLTADGYTVTKKMIVY